MKKTFKILNLIILGLSLHTSVMPMYGEILKGAMKEGAFRDHFQEKQFAAQTEIAKALKATWNGDAEKELSDIQKSAKEAQDLATKPIDPRDKFTPMRRIYQQENRQKRKAILTGIINTRAALKKEKEKTPRLEKALIDAKLSREFSGQLNFSAEASTRAKATIGSFHLTRHKAEPSNASDLKKHIEKIEQQANALIKSADEITFSRPFAPQSEFDDNTLLVYKACETARAMVQHVPLLKTLAQYRARLDKIKAKNAQLRQAFLDVTKK